jgi:hypothetical protein
VLDVRAQEILRALLTRGIIEEKARRMLLDLPTDQPVLDQLEWGDFEIARRAGTRDKIQNPPGFYIYLIETNCRVPQDFESSRKRQAREVAQKQRQDADVFEARRQLRLMMLEEQYANYCSSECEKYISSHLDAQDLEKRMRAARARVRKSWGINLPEASFEYYARQHLYDQVADDIKLMSLEEFSQQLQMTLPL